MSTALSRRSFLRLAGAGSAAAAFAPLLLTESQLARAQLPEVPVSKIPLAERVMINFNENPAGPCAAARAAITSVLPNSGRYLFDLASELVATFSANYAFKPGYVRAFAGSSDPLQYAILAYTTPRRCLVAADTTYEAAWAAAAANGARVVKVPLTADHAHDMRAMVEADPLTAVIYVCNPNNPTGTITPRAEIEWALAHKPKGSILLVDEAYIQYSDERSVLDLVAADKDLIVLRTFSKIYGMAGLRCGFAVGRPDLLKRLEIYGDNALPVTALAAAIASLNDASLVADRKRDNATVRAQTFAWLESNGYTFTRSASNCFMVDVGRPGKQVIAAMAERGVFVGRTWEAWPNHVRVTVGTRDEMARFRQAFGAIVEVRAAAGVDGIHTPARA